MWARRCGAPRTWPSRVKVFLYSLGTAAIGWTIYTFMASSNVGYLDLSRPSKDQVVCVAAWPGQGEARAWWNEHSWGDWWEYQADTKSYLQRYTCDVPLVSNMSCDAVAVPLSKLHPQLGAPLRLSAEPFDWKRTFYSKDALSIYSHLFLVLSICLWMAISCHDHALLHTVNKNYILDLQGISSHFPKFHLACGYLMSAGLIRRLVEFNKTFAQRLVGFSLALLISPVLILWRFVLFMFVVCPLMGFLFFFYPIRTSRLWTFLICLASMVYGVCLSIHMLIFATSDQWRPRYSVMWRAEATSMPDEDGGGAGTCYCGCPYPLSDSTAWRLFGIGLLATVKSFVVAFRCLKGLRRSNWANLMSVTFTVPVNAYSVEWTDPNGLPIKGRASGEPVQSELAFDPFALMDEQPESANSMVTLRPSSVMSWMVDEKSGQKVLRDTSNRNLMGPRAPTYEDPEAGTVDNSVEMVPVEYIGCCGFPIRTGGWQGRLQMLASEPEPPRSPSSPSQGSAARRRPPEEARSHPPEEPGLRALAPAASGAEAGTADKAPADTGRGRLLDGHRPAVLAPAPRAANPGLSLPRLRLLSDAPSPRTRGGLKSPDASPARVREECGREANLSQRLPVAFVPVVATKKPD